MACYHESSNWSLALASHELIPHLNPSRRCAPEGVPLSKRTNSSTPQKQNTVYWGEQAPCFQTEKKPLQIALKWFQQCFFLCGFFLRFNDEQQVLFTQANPKRDTMENKIYIYSQIEFGPIYYIQFVASSCLSRGAESVYSTPSPSL